MRLFVLIALSALPYSSIVARQRPILAPPKNDAWNMDYGDPISPVLARLIKTKYVRKATAAEAEMLHRAASVLPYPHIAREPSFVLLKPIAPSILDQLSGAYSVNFIVAPGVKMRDFGSSNTRSNVFSIEGRCLDGPFCQPLPQAPPAPPANR